MARCATTHAPCDALGAIDGHEWTYRTCHGNSTGADASSVTFSVEILNGRRAGGAGGQDLHRHPAQRRPQNAPGYEVAVSHRVTQPDPAR